MAIDFEAPKLQSPFRVLILGAAARGWYEASDDERSARILPRIKQMFEEWTAMGARALAGLDDDLFMTGEPQGTGYSWYLIFEVPGPDTVAAMIQRCRVTVDGTRLDRYVRLEARLGRPFFLLDEQRQP